MSREHKAGMKGFFEPRSIAVAGVSTDPNKLGSIIFQNLMENRAKGVLKASVYALNPVHELVGGSRAYPSIESLPEVPELLIVAVPEAQTESLVASAAQAGVQAAIIVTSGYAETGRKDVEERMAKVAARSGMRVMGPNTIGVVDPYSGVDSLFLRPTKVLPDGRSIASLLRPIRGGIVIVTQSGHLGQAIVEELSANEVGVRALVGTGNQVDVSVEDVVEYFGDDPRAKVIAVYIEGLHDGRKFMDVARRVSRRKPLVVLKVGKTGSGARAALTHTASLVGDYDVYRAAFRQSGAVEAESFQELVDFAISLSMLPPTGNRLAIVTNAGGVGAIAADEAQKSGLRVELPAPAALRRLRSAFRESKFISNASLGNPIDLTASVGTADFVRAVEEVARLPQYDAVLVLPTHQTPAMDPTVSERLVEIARRTRKAFAVCVIGRAELAVELHRAFLRSGVPSFPTPERTVRALAASWAYSKARERPEQPIHARVRPKRSVWKVGQLSYSEVTRLLGRYGVAGPKSVVVRSPEDFGMLGKVEYPVACKLLSVDLPHKTDAGGVVLGVKDAGEAKSCFTKLRKIAERRNADFGGVLVQEMAGRGVELILGGRRDPVFGPVVALGPGGTYVELSRDVSLAIGPLTVSGVRVMLEGTKLEKMLGGYRGGPRIPIGRLCSVVSSFSKILAENPSLGEIEVNPLIAGDTERTVEAARSLHERIALPNLMVKIPATVEGLPAIRAMIGE
ncbi:MAG: acetate--CoA ligase family protein, partial [Nitrososphaerota archaeon]|nr:acetate--CoA ligase family protein [Nitrososphaerota archaeon]